MTGHDIMQRISDLTKTYRRATWYLVVVVTLILLIEVYTLATR